MVRMVRMVRSIADRTFQLRSLPSGYYQGMNFIAAMLILATGDEECAFWLLMFILEDVLDPHFFATDPVLLGYHLRLF